MLASRSAIVTGAGRGIGAAVSRLLAQHGASVLVNDLDPAAAEATCAEITRAGGVAHPVAGSVMDEGFAEELVGASLAQHGSIDIVVNNAGHTQWAHSLHCRPATGYSEAKRAWLRASLASQPHRSPRNPPGRLHEPCGAHSIWTVEDSGGQRAHRVCSGSALHALGRWGAPAWSTHGERTVLHCPPLSR